MGGAGSWLLAASGAAGVAVASLLLYVARDVAERRGQPWAGDTGRKLPHLLERLGRTPFPGLDGAAALAKEEVLLAEAGLQHVLTAGQWRGIRLAAGLGLGGLATFAALTLALPGATALQAAVAGLLLGWLVPGQWLERRRKDRQGALRAALPALVDHLALGLAGGLNIRQSIALAAQMDDGPLADLLRQIDSALAVGASLPAAVQGALTGVEQGPVRLVLEGLVDAENLGTQYREALQEQSRFVQAMDRQEMQRRLNALPLQLMVVSLVFFMPAIFVVTLVPNLLALFRSGW